MHKELTEQIMYDVTSEARGIDKQLVVLLVISS